MIVLVSSPLTRPLTLVFATAVPSLSAAARSATAFLLAVLVGALTRDLRPGRVNCLAWRTNEQGRGAEGEPSTPRPAQVSRAAGDVARVPADHPEGGPGGRTSGAGSGRPGTPGWPARASTCPPGTGSGPG